jgi:hydroxymethylpyrimidine pyrophosphatase-like HAD family hydrolase
VSFRLLALDIDGTLLRSDKAISERTYAALAAARARGVRLVLVTGRRYPAAREVARQLGADTPLILHNGALVVEEGRVVRCRPLAAEVAAEAVRLARAEGADPVLHLGQQGEGRLVVEAPARASRLLSFYLRAAGSDVLEVPDLVAAIEEDPIQVMFGGPIEPMASLAGRLRSSLGARARIERTVYPEPGVGILDVLHPAAGKAEALDFLRGRWGVSAAATLAVGDNWNDREMLEQAGLGLVMGNADPAMLQLGLPVLPTNDKDGVAVAIERNILAASD